MKKILCFLKNILFAPFLIYLYNLIAVSLGFVVPINIISILIVGMLGFSGLFAIVIALYVLF